MALIGFDTIKNSLTLFLAIEQEWDEIIDDLLRQEPNLINIPIRSDCYKAVSDTKSGCAFV